MIYTSAIWANKENTIIKATADNVDYYIPVNLTNVDYQNILEQKIVIAPYVPLTIGA